MLLRRALSSPPTVLPNMISKNEILARYVVLQARGQLAQRAATIGALGTVTGLVWLFDLGNRRPASALIRVSVTNLLVSICAFAETKRLAAQLLAELVSSRQCR
jgi:hypothetical protein